MEEDVLKGKTLLVVDDEIDLRDIVASELEFMGAKVHQAENILKAQTILSEHKIDLIVSDIRMPGGTGIDLLDIVKSKGNSAPPVILITGFADITLENAFDKGAEALLNKPFKLDDLIKMVVRYTSPWEERFKGPLEASKSIDVSHTKSINFGRGGITIDITDQGKKFDVGEEIHFHMNTGTLSLEGKGICRWVKLNENHRVYMGLEFIHLEKESMSTFKKLLENKPTVSFIPAIHL